jgi:hypothetical protein
MDAKICVVIVRSNDDSGTDVKACITWLTDVILGSGKATQVTLETWDTQRFNDTLLLGPPSAVTRPIDIVILLGEGAQSKYDAALCSGTNFERINHFKCVHSILHFVDTDWRFKLLTGIFECMIGKSVKKALEEKK